MPTTCFVETNSYVVVVNPAPLAKRVAERGRDCWGSVVEKSQFCLALTVAVIFLGTVGLTYLFFITFSYIWIPLIVGDCHKSPGISLENLSILNMTVLNSTSTSDVSPLQLSSNFNLTFSTWNRNTVARCFTTYRTMNVDARFKNNLILRQAVPLGFALKPQKSRVVVMDLKGQGMALKEELGVELEREMRVGNVSLEFIFNTRYLRNDRKSNWKRFGCAIIARSPLVQGTGLETLIDQECYGY